MRVPLALHAVVLSLVLVPVLSAQDAVKTDPKHYAVISENAEVRILKIHYGPHEKSIMHSHPDSVAVALNDSSVHFTLPDGKTSDSTFKAGQAVFTPAGTHLPENTGDKGMDIILVELKGKSAMAKSEMK
jgi:hypothetical protein